MAGHSADGWTQLFGLLAAAVHTFVLRLVLSSIGRPVSAGCASARLSSSNALRESVQGLGRVKELEANGRPVTAAIEAVLESTPTGTGIHTASIERLNATFRSHLAPLVRRGRAIARTVATLEAGIWLVGCSYNFCWPHDSLRLAAPVGSGRKWTERTPAMAAGLADHPGTLRDLLQYRVPPPAWVAPKRRGRPPKQVQLPSMLRAA